MAVLTVSGESGCRVEETARLVAQRLGFELVTGSTLDRLVEAEFGPESELPDKAWPHVMESMLSRLATEHHLVVCAPHAEMHLRRYPAVMRMKLVAPVSHRAGAVMVDQRLERPAALESLKSIEREIRNERRSRYGRATLPTEVYDLSLNAATLDPDSIADLIAAAARAQQLDSQGLMSEAANADIQFRVRLQLARHQMRPPGEVKLKRTVFCHPSEEIFANLLDFYRIAWEYEPRSFELDSDENGQIREAFTPDFYLPEFDLYVELTTMKQALVTRKNRKIKLLRQRYPEVNIQIFYQKDFQNLIFKYGLSEPAAAL